MTTIYKLFRYPRGRPGRVFLQEDTTETILLARQEELRRLARHHNVNCEYIIHEEESPNADIAQPVVPEAGTTATGERYSSLADLI